MNDGRHRRNSAICSSTTALFAACLMASAHVSAQASRGELLYSTHCVSCHSAQIHWRDKRLATNWASLKAQVSRWQANAGLGWRDADIVEVTRFLNERHYHFPQTGEQVGWAEPRERDCPPSKDDSSGRARAGMAKPALMFTVVVNARRRAAA